MLEILQFYVSSFWIWVGITFGLALVGGLLHEWIRAIRGRSE